MIEIASITSTVLELKGISFNEGDKVQKILDICHKWKHMYMEGYPCGRTTRKQSKTRFKRWGSHPGICFTYLLTDDNEKHNLAIHVIISDMQKLRKKYSEREIMYYAQMYLQNVADEIISIN